MKRYHIQTKPNYSLRIAATLIDYSIYSLFLFVFIWCLGTEDESGKKAVEGLSSLIPILVWFLYFVVVEAYNQATPGHDICGLRVVKTSGENVNLYDAFKRRILDLVDFGIYGIPALICISKTPKNQRLGDLFAGTVVIKKLDIAVEEVTF